MIGAHQVISIGNWQGEELVGVRGGHGPLEIWKTSLLFYNFFLYWPLKHFEKPSNIIKNLSFFFYTAPTRVFCLHCGLRPNPGSAHGDWTLKMEPIGPNNQI